MVIKKNVLQFSVLFVFVVFVNGLMGMKVTTKSTHYTFRNLNDDCWYDGQIDQLIKKYIKVNKDNIIDCSYANFKQFSHALLINIQRAQKNNNAKVDDIFFINEVVATYKYFSLGQVFEISSVLQDNVRSAIEKEVQKMHPNLNFVAQSEKLPVYDNNSVIKIPLRGSTAFFLEIERYDEMVYLVNIIDHKRKLLQDVTLTIGGNEPAAKFANCFSLSPDGKILVFHTQNVSEKDKNETKIFRTSDCKNIFESKCYSSSTVYFYDHEILIMSCENGRDNDYRMYRYKLSADYEIENVDVICNINFKKENGQNNYIKKIFDVSDNLWSIENVKDYVFCSPTIIMYLDNSGKAHRFDTESKKTIPVSEKRIFTNLHYANNKFCLLQDDEQKFYYYDINNDSISLMENVGKNLQFLAHSTADILYFIHDKNRCAIFDTVERKEVYTITLNQSSDSISIEIDPTGKIVILRTGDTTYFANAYTGNFIGQPLPLPQGVSINYNNYGDIEIIYDKKSVTLQFTYQDHQPFAENPQVKIAGIFAQKRSNFSIFLFKYKFLLGSFTIGCLSALYAWFHWYK